MSPTIRNQVKLAGVALAAAVALTVSAGVRSRSLGTSTTGRGHARTSERRSNAAAKSPVSEAQPSR